jgi:hypothetical protein
VKTEKSAVHVVEQCAWAIGNVAGDGEVLRDVLLKQGALHSLSRHLLSPVPSLSRTAAWALSNLIKVGFLGIFPQMCLLK